MCQPYIESTTVLSDIYMYKKIVNERTRDLIYLKFVATDFFPKIIGRAKRAPHSRFRVIYIYRYVCLSYVKITA